LHGGYGGSIGIAVCGSHEKSTDRPVDRRERLPAYSTKRIENDDEDENELAAYQESGRVLWP
jgi:hypothetical protein